jgi:flagella basal body P-ring formation protein FlgA
MSSRTAILSFVLVLATTATALAAGPALAGNATGNASPQILSATTSTALPLTREYLLTALSRDLVAHYNLEGDLDLELLRAWSPPAQIATTWAITITEYPTVAASSMLLRCRVVVDGNVVAEPTLVVRAALWRDVWAARNQLTFGATFEPSMLEARRIDMFRERDALPAAVGDRSYVFARGVSAGRLLTWRDIARRPLVKKGDMVDVSAIEGTLVVTMKAVAMENGSQGDTVTVRNPDSRKDFAAMVIDENRVQVRF